jgi:hypothetical protein
MERMTARGSFLCEFGTMMIPIAAVATGHLIVYRSLTSPIGDVRPISSDIRDHIRALSRDDRDGVGAAQKAKGWTAGRLRERPCSSRAGGADGTRGRYGGAAMSGTACRPKFDAVVPSS